MAYGMTECCGKISVSRLEAADLALPRAEQLRLRANRYGIKQGTISAHMFYKILDVDSIQPQALTLPLRGYKGEFLELAQHTRSPTPYRVVCAKYACDELPGVEVRVILTGPEQRGAPQAR